MYTFPKKSLNTKHYKDNKILSVVSFNPNISGMLKASLVDDELNNLASLEFLLHNDCESMNEVGKVFIAGQARDWLAKYIAYVIFLDINYTRRKWGSVFNYPCCA